MARDFEERLFSHGLVELISYKRSSMNVLPWVGQGTMAEILSPSRVRQPLISSTSVHSPLYVRYSYQYYSFCRWTLATFSLYSALEGWPCSRFVLVVRDEVCSSQCLLPFTVRSHPLSQRFQEQEAACVLKM